MPCHLQLHVAPTYVEAVYLGVLTAAELGEAAERIVSLGKEHGTHCILADCTALVGGHSITDLYQLAEWLSAHHPGFSIREALLVPTCPVPDENFRFWETACHNRGFVVRMFTAREPALAWLLA